MALASCTTIGPTVPVSAGVGKSGPEFDQDRKDCMDATDRTLQPVADEANRKNTTAQDVAASNQRIQVAFDRQYDRCMASRGNLVPAPAVPIQPQPTPPDPGPALEGRLRVSDASNLRALSDPDSIAAKRSIAPKVRELLAACPGETIAVTAYDATLTSGVISRLLTLTQPHGGGCLGHIGEADFLVAETPAGAWRTLLSAEPGSIGIRMSGNGGYRDVELRSFGTCVYGYRWNGLAFYSPAADTHDCTLPAPVAPGGYADPISGR